MSHNCAYVQQHYQVPAEVGVKWQLYPVDFKTEEGTFSVYLYAINREHAAAILLELKETAVLRDGDLAGITRND